MHLTNLPKKTQQDNAEAIDQLNAQAELLNNKVNTHFEKAMSQLEQVSKELTAKKTDRHVLAGLLTELADNLKNESN